MSLKSIRESYSKLLTVFNDAGVKLNESQKSDIDTFVLAIESTMQKQREAAIRETKKAVEAKMEKEYRQVFESVMDAMRENAALAAKVQDKVTQINESRRISGKVNDFLDLYVESVLPKKTIVDYDRMQKLEKIHESLKDALVVTDEAVEEKTRQLEESYKVKKSECETQVAKMQVKLNESMKKAQELKEQIGEFKAAQLLESKVKDLPTFEARKVRKALHEATTEEIEENFDKTLKEVRKQAKCAEQEDEKTVKSEVEEILEQDDGVEENDILKDKPHNAHVPANESGNIEVVPDDDYGYEAEYNASLPPSSRKTLVRKSEAPVDSEDDKFETMEEVEFDENGDVELDESEVIDSDLMKVWCMQSQEVS